MPLGEEIPLERRHQRGVPPAPLEIVILSLLAHSAKTVGDRHRLEVAAYHNKHCWRAFSGTNIDDLEQPWTPQNRGLWWILAILGSNTHFKTIAPKPFKIDQDNLHMKCSALNVDFNGVRFDTLGSRSPPYQRIKFGYPLQNVEITGDRPR